MDNPEQLQGTPQLSDSEAQNLMAQLEQGDQISIEILGELKYVLGKVKPYLSPEYIAKQEEQKARDIQREIERKRYVFGLFLNFDDLSPPYPSGVIDALGRKGWKAIAEAEADIMDKIKALRPFFKFDKYKGEIFWAIGSYPHGRYGGEGTGRKFNLISGEGENAEYVDFDYEKAARDICLRIEDIIFKWKDESSRNCMYRAIDREDDEITEEEKAEVDKLLKLALQIFKFDEQEPQIVGNLTGIQLTGDLLQYAVPN